MVFASASGVRSPKRKPVPSPVALVVAPDRVDEPAGGAHDRQRPVAQAVHLVQAAGLEARRHDEEVGARLDPVGERRRRSRSRPGSDRGRRAASAPKKCSASWSPVPSRTICSVPVEDPVQAWASTSNPFCETSRPIDAEERAPRRRRGAPPRAAGPPCSASFPDRSLDREARGQVLVGAGIPLVDVDAVQDADAGPPRARAARRRGRSRRPGSGSPARRWGSRWRAALAWRSARLHEVQRAEVLELGGVVVLPPEPGDEHRVRRRSRPGRPGCGWCRRWRRRGAACAHSTVFT